MADYDLQYQDTYVDALLATANELKTAGYIFKGVATPSTNPGTPTERVAYLASEPGTYTNFGGIVITSGLYSLIYASGTWAGTQMQAGSDIEVVQTTGDSTTDVISQKAVTDELDEIGKDIGDGYIVTPSLWEQGAIASTTGLDTESTTRIRTIGLHHATSDFVLTPAEGYQLYVIYYDANGNFLGSSGWNTTVVRMYTNDYYRLVFAYTNTSTIVNTDITGNLGISAISASKRLMDVTDEISNKSKWGGNLFIPADSINGVSSPNFTVTANGNNLTFTYPRKKNQTIGAFAYLPKLVIGREYRISMDYNLGSAVTLSLKNALFTVTYQYFTSKRKGTGSLCCDFVYTSDMYESSLIGFAIEANTAANTIYELNNIELYDISDVDKSTIENVDLDKISVLRGFLPSLNIWYIGDASSLNSEFSLIDVSAHRGGQAIISTTSNSIIAFLLNDSHLHETDAEYADGSSREYINNLNNCGKYIPDDAQYMYISVKSTTGASIIPTSISLIGGYSKKQYLSEFEELTRKRITPMANIRWEALSNISGNYCTAGIKVGLLYSSCVEVDRYIGEDISVKTFMTAANNPYSLLYTENLATKTSGYGFTYYNSGATVHAWMGTVCSRFVFAALGQTEWDTAHFAWLCSQGILQKSKSQASEDVEIGDIIWIPGHTRIIYDVIKSGGIATKIVVSEAAQPLVIATDYTPTTLDDYMATNHGIFYKYAGERNMVYEPSEFVNNLGEPLPDDYAYNDDLCTYAGDYAAFRIGYPVWINYNLKSIGAWTTLQLYKESWSDSNVLTLQLINSYTIDTSIHRIQIPSADIAVYGKYRARLTDGTNYSDYTFFEMIETNVSYSTPDNNDSDVKKVTFSSSNGTPSRVVFTNKGGTPMAIRPLTMQEKMDGWVVFNPVKASAEQRSGTLPTGQTYIKVYFIGEYGRVTNEPLLTDF